MNVALNPALEVDGHGSLRVRVSRGFNSTSKKHWWCIGVYHRDIAVASIVGSEGGSKLDFTDEGDGHFGPGLWLGSARVSMPRASWEQLKTWAEGLTAEGT